MKHFFIRNTPAFLFMILFAMLITACGSAPTASTPTPTPTPIRPTPTPTPSLIIYRADGYQIGYPDGWTVQNGSTANRIQFQDAAQDTILAEAATSANGHVSTTAGMQAALALFKTGFKNYKDVTIPAQVTINGLTWDQKAATIDGPKAGQTGKITILATQDPKNAAKLGVLIFMIPDITTFDTLNAQVFQPMLQSFAFQD